MRSDGPPASLRGAVGPGRPGRGAQRVAVAVTLALLAAASAAQEPGEAPSVAASEQQQPASPARPGWQLLPAGKVYQPYRADPQQPGFAFVETYAVDEGVPQSGRARVGLKLGGHFPLLQYVPAGAPERPIQLVIEAGFYGQFDQSHSLDNLGWDGIYRFVLTRRLAAGPAVKVGLQHVSSHVGDEYAERTGRRRIGYTRNEWAAALSVPLGERWRVYGEGGWSTSAGEGPQEAGRLQAGVEVEVPGGLRGGRWGWYAALDAGAREERDWRLEPSLQVGVVAPAGDRRWRAGLGVRHGGVPIGELFQHDETHVYVGLFLDL